MTKIHKKKILNKNNNLKLKTKIKIKILKVI